MKDVYLTGLAANWTQKFWVPYAPHRRQFTMGCFSEWIRNDSQAKVQINHCPDLQLRTLLGARFEETREGLRLSFFVRPGRDGFTDDVVLALRCGYFGGLSLGYAETRCSLHCRDNTGRYGKILSAVIDEVSLVDRPLLNTSIGFRFNNRPSAPISPKSKSDRRRLDAFLERIEYRHPPKLAAKPAEKESPATPWRPPAAELLEINKTIQSLRPVFF